MIELTASLVLLLCCIYFLFPSASCRVFSLGMAVSHFVYNVIVVWFPLCCEGSKSPSLPRPDTPTGKSIMTLPYLACFWGGYVAPYLVHNSASLCVVSLFPWHVAVILHIFVLYNPVLCANAPTQTRQEDWVWLCSESVTWLFATWAVCVASLVGRFPLPEYGGGRG